MSKNWTSYKITCNVGRRYSMASILFFFFVVSISALNGLPADNKNEAKSTAWTDVAIYSAGLEGTYPHLKRTNVQDMIHKNGIMYLLEMGNHRIIAFKDNVRIKQIGRIGQKPGEFYYPMSFLIDAKENFYVLDFVEKGANRVQKLNSSGVYINGFLTGVRSWGFGADSQGNIYLGQPHYGSIITAYNPGGKKLRRIGELVLPSDIYGKKYERYDPGYKIPMNRVNIVIDEKDNIWVGFLFMPLILKYSPTGALLFKKVLDMPAMLPVQRAVWEPGSKEGKQYLSRSIDGMQMTVMVKEMVYNSNLKRLYILLGSNEILVLDPAGAPQYIIKPDFIKGALERLFINEHGDMIVKFFFNPELFKLVIKNSNNKIQEELK